MDTLNSGADGASENDDLRSTLASALESGVADMQPEAATLEPPTDEVDPIAQEAAADAKSERSRDELGRFAKEVKEAQDAAAAQQAAQAPAKPAEQAQEAPQEQGQPAQQGQRPPPGWSPQAKSEFDKLSPAVREAVIRREEEVNRGLSKLAEYKGLDPYVNMARSAGTDLPQALERYVAAEQFLEKSPVEGLLWLAQNYGITPQRLVQAMSGQAQIPQQPYQQGMPQPQPAAIPPVIQQRLDALTQTVQTIQSERLSQQMGQIDAALETFLADPANRYAENVAAEMAPLISARRSSNPKEAYSDTLKWAYQKAVWANDEIRPLLLNEQLEARTQAATAAAKQARAASRSVVGSPTPGVSTGQAPAPTLRDEIARQLSAGRV